MRSPLSARARPIADTSIHACRGSKRHRRVLSSDAAGWDATLPEVRSSAHVDLSNYDYTNQDPVNTFDLDGQCPWCAAVAIVAARAALPLATHGVPRGGLPAPLPERLPSPRRQFQLEALAPKRGRIACDQCVGQSEWLPHLEYAPWSKTSRFIRRIR